MVSYFGSKMREGFHVHQVFKKIRLVFVHLQFLWGGGHSMDWDFPGGASGKEATSNFRRCGLFP